MKHLKIAGFIHANNVNAAMKKTHEKVPETSSPIWEMLKAKLTVQIFRLIKARGRTQTEASKLLGTTQAQVSALMRCRPVSVSVGRLMEFLTILGQDVEVNVRPAAPRKAGHMSVVVQP